ncbi:TetR/AcrR family transcriptional regulator [Amorphoplanes digitatis]|uniref:AcrR family transcriptional regulator n=1 Tax=Actinoplanes digitatis TaxID=1868 RepID=A0A7W7I2G5_9ACTN|nr:TetR/AcrR family transcriptional regulator [Actinoplanes digitatis]MBB4765238.1 AcrR family transcriptional regulator [Actinoplanes digitatis]GID94690.1 TetR family transcriptional regulator [Actinoplanes digitatis]
MDDAQGTPPRRGAYEKGVRRRREILDRAIEVFAERGAEGTSLRAIGEAIGVSHAALKHYFSSREELLIEVYRAAEERSIVEDRPPAGVSVVGIMTHAARRNHGVPGLVQLYSTLVAGALEEGNELSRAFFGERFALLRRFLAERVEAEQAAGRIRPDIAPEAAAALIIAASDGLQTQWLLDPRIDIEKSLELLEGLLGR